MFLVPEATKQTSQTSSTPQSVQLIAEIGRPITGRRVKEVTAYLQDNYDLALSGALFFKVDNKRVVHPVAWANPHSANMKFAAGLNWLSTHPDGSGPSAILSRSNASFVAAQKSSKSAAIRVKYLTGSTFLSAKVTANSLNRGTTAKQTVGSHMHAVQLVAKSFIFGRKYYVGSSGAGEWISSINHHRVLI